MKLAFIGIVLIFILAGFSTPKKISQWRGPNRDGIYPETNLLKQWPTDGPKMLWSFQELGTGQGSVAVAGDRVFVTGIPDTVKANGFLFAFGIDGKLLWKKSYGKDWAGIYPGTHSTPTVVDDLVYIENGAGKVHCLKASNGDEVWSEDFFKDFQADSVQFGFSESLLVDGDKLYCTPGGKTNNVVALNRFTGEKLWSSTGSGEKATYSSPIVVRRGQDELFVNLTASSIIGIDAKNGQINFKIHQIQDNFIHGNTPVYFDEKLLISSPSRRDTSGLVLLQLSPDPKKADIVWRNKEFVSLSGGYIVKNGFMYGGAYLQPKWYCIDLKTGQPRYIAKDFGGGPVIYADGLFYCYSEKDGEIALVDATPEKFQVISKFKVPLGTAQHWAHPVIADGKLYVRHNEALMVYDIQKR